MKAVSIYALIDPETGQTHYIGKAGDPTFRLTHHLAGARNNPRYACARWIRSLLDRGLTPRLVVLETVREDEWEEAEKRQISAHRASGAPLTNETLGGFGAHKRSLHPLTHLSLDQVEQALERCAAGEQVESVARDLGVLKSAVYDMIAGRTWHEESFEPLRIRASAWVEKRRSGSGRWNAKLTEAQVPEIARRYSAGQKQSALAREFGVSQALISRVIHGKNFHSVETLAVPGNPNSRPKDMPKGDACSWSKITADDVREIRYLAANGTPQTQLALQFNVSRASICLIVNRKNWKHIA